MRVIASFGSDKSLSFRPETSRTVIEQLFGLQKQAEEAAKYKLVSEEIKKIEG